MEERANGWAISYQLQNEIYNKFLMMMSSWKKCNNVLRAPYNTDDLPSDRHITYIEKLWTILNAGVIDVGSDISTMGNNFRHIQQFLHMKQSNLAATLPVPQRVSNLSMKQRLTELAAQHFLKIWSLGEIEPCKIYLKEIFGININVKTHQLTDYFET